MIEYLDLADYLAIAVGVTGLDIETILKVTNLNLADSALHAPAAGFGDTDFYPDFVDKAAVLIVRLARNHPLPDGNKRAAWVASPHVHRHRTVGRGRRLHPSTRPSRPSSPSLQARRTKPPWPTGSGRRSPQSSRPSAHAGRASPATRSTSGVADHDPPQRSVVPTQPSSGGPPVRRPLNACSNACTTDAVAWPSQMRLYLERTTGFEPATLTLAR